MKRILLLIKGLGRGGAEQLLATSARHFDRSRFEFQIAYLLPSKDALVPEFEDAGFLVHCLDGTDGTSWVRRLRGLVKRHRIDLVHAHSPLPAIGARVGLHGHAKIVYTEHNVWSRYRSATYWGNALTYPLNDHVFAVAQSVSRSIRYPRVLRWRPMPKVEVLYQGLDLEEVPRWSVADGIRAELGIDAEAPLVGTVANFKAHKGYDVLLRAVIQVRKAIPEVRFVFAGVGPMEDQLKEQATSLGLNETVVFAGFREDVPRLMASLDAFTLASRQEGLAIALLEALAVGKPVVVTDVGGLPEVVADGEQGFLVPPGDADLLADRLITVLMDPSLRDKFANSARRRAADFDIKYTVARAEEVYEALLS